MQEASSAAQAMHSPGAADDILAQMSGSHPGTPDAAAMAIASNEVSEGAGKGSAAADQQDSTSAQRATSASADAPPAKDLDAAAPVVDSKAEGDPPATPSDKSAPSGDSVQPPAAKPASTDVEPPKLPSEAAHPPMPDSVAPTPPASLAAASVVASTSEQEPSSPAAGSLAGPTAAQLAEPESAADGTPEHVMHLTLAATQHPDEGGPSVQMVKDGFTEAERFVCCRIPATYKNLCCGHRHLLLRGLRRSRPPHLQLTSRPQRHQICRRGCPMATPLQTQYASCLNPLE